MSARIGLWGTGLGLALLAAGCSTPCDEIEDTTDYTADDNWICLPDRDDLCAADMSVVEVGAGDAVTRYSYEPEAEPWFDCFYVYPTMDLRMRAGVHEDLTDLDDEALAVQAQAVWMQQSCRLVVPAYRQVTLGTYLKRVEKREPCFEVAYRDVAAAFDHYLEQLNDGRPYVLLGHSQGGQLVSRLHREHAGVDERLLASYPLGWAVDAERQCDSASELDCMVSFKSYLAGEEIPDSSSYQEGETVACVIPASPNEPETQEVLAGTLFRARSVDGPADTSADYLLYRDAVTARCQGTGSTVGLEVQWTGAQTRPFELDDVAVAGANGAHVFDVAWAAEDLRQDMKNRAWIWYGRR